MFIDFQRAVHYKKIGEIICLIGFAIAFGPRLMNIESVGLLILGLLIFSGGAIFIFIKWRCPVCGRHLSERVPAHRLRHCQGCGTKLQV